MITLCLSGFRCYEEEKTFTFTPGQIIRIRGRSGSGKTTLFEAIQWVLYNYPTANIYPRHSKSNNTRVTLTLPWKEGFLTIERRKNPSLLLVTHPDGSQEEDDVAQATIDNYFGSRDIWRVCCYLPQGENCPLLGFSNSQRMEILEALAFLNEKPEEVINKIVEEIHRLQIEFNRAEEKLKHTEAQLKEIQLPSEPTELLIPDDIREGLIERQKDIKVRIKTLEQQYLIAEERKKQRRLIQDRLEKSRVDLEKIPNPGQSKIIALEEEIKELQEELPFSQQGEAKQRLESQRKTLLDKLANLRVPDREYTHQEYQETFSLEKKIIEEQRVAETWKISYHPETIQKRIIQIKSLLDAQKDIQVWMRIKSLQDKLELLTGPEVSQEDLDKAREELKTLERSIDVYKCPSCKRSLRFLRGNLVLSETSPVPADRIKKFKDALVQMEAAYRNSHERRMVRVQLESLLSTVTSEPLQVRPLKPAEIKKLEQELVELGRLVFPEKPKISSQEMKKAEEYFNLRKDLLHLEKELEHYPQHDRPLRQTNVIITRLNTCQTQLRQLRDIVLRREALENQIKTHLRDLDNLPLIEEKDIREELDRLQNEDKEIQTKFNEDQIARNYLDLKKKYQQEADKVNELNTELAAAIRLKDLANREVCEILEEKIGTINLTIAEVCNKIFREPITIELSMLKTTKSTKVTKPCVHLKIWYKEGEYDSLAQLSGGEGKRISIAVSLALTQLNNFPILLLDECLNGLDDELKEATLGIMSEMSTGKTVVCIMHDGVNGLYDSLVDLDELQ